MDGMGFGMSRVGSFKDVLSWFDILFVNYGASESQNLKTAFVAFYSLDHYPKYPDPSKVPILRTRTPAIQVPTPPLKGPRILRVDRIPRCFC